MTVLTATQINDLNRMNAASQRMPGGGLGTFLDSAVAIINLNETAPALGTNTAVHAAITLAVAAADVTTAITNPDVPRTLIAKGNASGITGNVVITGTNYNDEVITDTIALNGSSAVEGVKAFKTVTNIHLPAETHSGTDTVSIGTGNKIGLSKPVTNTAYLLTKLFDGSSDAGTLTTSATVEGTFYALAGTLNGVKKLTLLFVAL